MPIIELMSSEKKLTDGEIDQLIDAVAVQMQVEKKYVWFIQHTPEVKIKNEKINSLQAPLVFFNTRQSHETAKVKTCLNLIVAMLANFFDVSPSKIYCAARRVSDKEIIQPVL